MPDVMYLVIERSDVGETVLGVFSSLDRARQILPPLSSGRLEHYRVEYRLLDQPPEPRTPWQVVLSRDGTVVSAEVVIRCSCEDDDRRLARGSFIERGGQRLCVVVWAASPGQAIAAAQRYRAWLLERELWDSQGRQLPPIEADPEVPSLTA